VWKVKANGPLPFLPLFLPLPFFPLGHHSVFSGERMMFEKEIVCRYFLFPPPSPPFSLPPTSSNMNESIERRLDALPPPFFLSPPPLLRLVLLQVKRGGHRDAAPPFPLFFSLSSPSLYQIQIALMEGSERIYNEFTFFFFFLF